jgi:hypothetical protein
MTKKLAVMASVLVPADADIERLSSAVTIASPDY